MAIQDDISVGVDKAIRHAAGTAHYTVLELHRFLGALADDESASGDDFVDITSLTPSERSTDAIVTLLDDYNIDDDLAEYLYGGSILQTGGATLYSGLQVLGAVNNTDTQLMVIQNNEIYTYTTTPANPFWGTQSGGGWNGDSVSGILMRVLIKSRDGGVDIDGKRIRVQARHWGDTYDFFNVTLGQGESVAAIGTTPDAQNTTTQGTVTAYGDVVNIEGYQEIDLNNGNGLKPYYSQWTFGAQPDGLKALWEFTKDLSGNGTAKTTYGISGELFLGITHSYPYGTPAGGEFAQNVVMTWGTGLTAGTGLLLADDQTGDVMYMQLLTGVAPTSGETITGGAATHDLTSNPSSKTVPKIFGGSYTGTWIGAFGFGIDKDDLTSSDTVQDLAGVTQTPPNNVTFTVSGLSTVAIEDRILVAPRAGGVIDTTQMTTDGAQTSGVGSYVVASIPTDTPSAGTVRILCVDEIYHRVPYDSYTGVTFTLTGTLPANVTDLSGSYVSYIDQDSDTSGEASFTTIYDTDRDLFVRVRDGKATPIKTSEAPATLTSAGGSSVASRITDE